MSKQLTNFELAEMTSILLTNPEVFGELESMHKQLDFMRDIAEAIATACGGQPGVPSAPDCEEQIEPGGVHHLPMIGFSPSDCLPAVHSGMFSMFDPSGWEDEEGVDGDDLFTTAKLKQNLLKRREALIKFHEQALEIIDAELNWPN